MKITLKPPWEKSILPGAVLLFAAALLLAFMAGFTVRAEEPEAPDGWYEEYDYTLDDEEGIMQLTQFIGTSEHLVIPGTASLPGKSYQVHLTARMFDVTNGEAVKSLYLCSGVKLPNSCDNMFRGLSSAEALEFGPDFDSSNVTSMIGCFRNLTSLRSIDLSMLDTENVTTLECLFTNCIALETVDLTGWNTSKVFTFYGVFQYCENLREVDVTGLDTSEVKLVMQMFQNCKSLTSLDLTGWNTGKLTNMYEFLKGAESLTEIDLSMLDTSNVTTFGYMLYGCTSLKTAILRGLNMEKGETFDYMFYNDQELEQVDFTGTTLSNATKLSAMFSGCRSLTSLDLSGWNLEKLTKLDSMFRNCEKLTSLDVSGFHTENVTSMQYMFENCSSLRKLDLSGFDMTSVTSTYLMFNGANALWEIKTPKVMGGRSTDLPLPFYPRDQEGNLIMENRYRVLETAPVNTWIYYFYGFTVIFVEENFDSENRFEQKIECDKPTPLRLNTFVKEGYIFMGWSRMMNDSTPEYSDGQVVMNLWGPNVGVYLFPVWRPVRSFTFTIPASAQLTFLEDHSLGAEIPYSIAYTGRNADCIRVIPDAGRLEDAFGNQLTLNCWNNRSNWFVFEDGGGTLNAETGFYEGTGVIKVSVNNSYLAGIRPGLYTGTLTVSVSYL